MRNLTFKAAMLNDSRTTVNRQSTDGQSQRHYKQTPLSKRWKVLMTLVFLFTFAIGNVWAVDVTIAQPANPGSTTNDISYGLFIVSHNNNAVYSSGAIKAAQNGDEVTITFTTTKSDMYIKSVEFESLSNGSIESADGTKSGNVFTISGNKNSVAIKLKSSTGKKGSVKFKNAVINSGSNDLEAITFNSYDSSSKAFSFTSSSATSALTSITQSTNKSPSVSSKILSWPNQGDVVFTSSRKIQYIALLLNDAKNYDSFKENNGSGDALTNHVWTGNSNAVTIYNGTGGGRSIKNVYVVFAPATYTLAWNLDGGSVDVAGTAAGSYTAGTTITAPTVSKSGYAFNGWDPAVPATMPAANSEYTATWTANTHSLVWNIPGDATITNSETYTHGTVAYGTAIVAPTLSREGYDFLGWDVTPAATMPDNDLTYTAKWQDAAAKHSITYADYGSADISGYPTEYSEGIGIASFAPLADTEDQHFLGWDPATIAASATTNQTITATWEAKKVVSFNTGLGSAIADVKVVSGEVVAAPTAPTRLNWTFQKWQKEGVDYDFATPVTEDITLDAVWSRDEISGTPTDIVLVSTSAAIGSTSPLTDVYYGNAEWTYTGNAKISTGGAMFGTPNAKKWVGFTLPNGYVATVTANSTSSNDRHCVLVTEADRAGIAGDATFLLDITTNSSTTTATSSSFGAGSYALGSTSGGIDINSVVVHVSEAPIMVTFKTGEATYAAISATSGEKLGNLFLNGELPSGLVVPGYTFNGWADVTKETEITASMTVQANLTPVTYNVTLNKGLYGSTNGAATVGFGDAALTITSAATAPTGYTLLGYFTAADGETKVAEADGSFVDETIAGYIASGKWNNAGDATLYAHWQDNSAVAKIGTTMYANLAEAVAYANAHAGSEIVLLKDVDVTAQIEITANTILDLNGHTIEYVGDATLPSGVILVHNGASLTINDSSDPDAGSIVSGDKAYAAVALTKLGDDASTPATLVVNGGALTGYYYGITGNGSRNNTVITINGGTITGTVGIAIYHPQVGTLTVNDGSLTGLDAAIEMRAGTLVINDGTFTATATEFSCNPNGSGSTTSGAAIAIAQHTTKKEISVTINGGTFNGVKALNESNPQVNDPAPQVTMAVTAGTFTGEVTTVDVDKFISGGTFDHEVAANHCAENYAPKDNGDGTYGVKPLATSIDIEGYYVDGSHGTVAEALAAHNYTLTADMSDSKKVAWDNNSNAYDKGLKIKEDAKTFSFDVAADKLVAFKTGIISGATLSVNGSAAEDLTITDKSDASIKTRYYYSENAQSFVFTTTTASYNIIKSVTIEDPYVVTFNANGGEDVTAMEFHGTALTLPNATKGTEVFKGWYDAAEDGNLIGKAGESYTPTADVTLYAQWEAVSSDATLSALEVDEATVAGFDPETYIYNIVCEYGLQPTITKATATAGALATVTINNTPVDEGTYKYVQVKVVPQSGEEDQKFYQVRYTNLPKKGVSLIKATHTGAKTADVTGYLGGTYDKNTANDGKLGDANTYFGIKLTEGNFQAGDVLYIHASTVSSAVRIYSDKGTTRINAEDGTFDANKMFTYTLTAETEWIYIYRKVKDGESDMNPYVDYIEVQRHMDPFIAELKVGDALATIDEEANPKTITIEVPASTDITALTPSIKAYANGGATVTPADPQDFNAGAVAYTVTSYYGETTTYQVTVTKAEVSHDATLSALSVAGYSLSPAFDPAVLTYNVELPKGTVIADLPAVSYTLNHAGATAVKTNAAALPGATTIVVTAEDGLEENKKTYTINFTVSTKDKVVIFDGSEASPAIHEAPTTIDGLSWTVTGLSVGTNKAIAPYTKTIATGGSTGTSKNIAVTIPSKYNVQFELVQVTNSSGDARYAYIGEANNTSFANALFTLGSTDQTKNEKGISEALAGGKTYYIHSSNSINFSEIVLYLDRVSEAPAISAQPAALAACDAATNTNALSVTASVEAGTLSYQWYKVVEEGDDETVGTNSNEFVPTAVGEYYVVVTNAEGEYAPSSTKSETATVSLKAQTEITGTVNVKGDLGATTQKLSVTATGAGELTYAWFAYDIVNEETTGAKLSETNELGNLTITEETQYYQVTVTGDCGSVSEILTVSKWIAVEQADVTGSKTWDWNKTSNAAAWSGVANIQLTGADRTTDIIMANTSSAMPNNEHFRSDMLVTNGEYPARPNQDNGVFQGYAIKFHTTVPGVVAVTYRGTGNSEVVKLQINDWADETGISSTKDNMPTKKMFVPAGDVTIKEKDGKVLRIEKIVFNAEPDYTRSVTEGRYGTICLPNGGVMVGATLYEVAYYGQTSKKIFFDEILNGEMVAGVPYIFLPKEGASQLAVYYTDEANESAKNANGLHGFIGANADAEMNVPVGAYILNANQYREVVTLGTAKIKSNRSYIELGEISPSEPALAPGRRRISMSVYSEQVATGIENTGFESEAPRKVLINGELFIIRGEKMYDAKGQLVK